MPLFKISGFYHPGMSLGMCDLKVGCRYLTNGGYFIRTITAINGEEVEYVDQCGSSSCKRTTFVKRCSSIISDAEAAQLEAQEVERVEKAPAIDHVATNKLLGIVIHVQNQLDGWFKGLEQSAELYAPVLTPSQIAVHQDLQEEYAAFAKRLQHYQYALAR